MDQFKQSLSDIPRYVSACEQRSVLVVMIDELDRCRPSFAVELLELVKHLFSVENVVFVIAINRTELAHSIQALYGVKFDALGYLGRFFDVDLKLPNPDREQFIRTTIESVGIRGYLGRTSDVTGSSELQTLESLLEFFFKVPSISLRSIEQSVHRLGLVYASLLDNQRVLGTTIAVLVILRTIDRELYYEFVHGKTTDKTVLEKILERFGLSLSVEQPREIAVFEAWLIAMQIERDDRQRPADEFEPSSTPLYSHCAFITSQEQRNSDSASKSEVLHADQVLELLNVILADSRHFQGVLQRAAVDRIELFSGHLVE